ncbi:hypothetical protein HBI69_193630 [Parastagonospora nodorum]|nr:hypothetical protein HBI69_193630 [Parastagonospora nodorum]
MSHHMQKTLIDEMSTVYISIALLNSQDAITEYPDHLIHRHRSRHQAFGLTIRHIVTNTLARHIYVYLRHSTRTKGISKTGYHALKRATKAVCRTT